MPRTVRLRELRERRILSQGELAERAGLSRCAVNRLERPDGPMPRPSTARRLAAALDVEPSQLFAERDDTTGAPHA
jgi:transcriptional regulator with XRE-family HTH domain